MLKRQFQIWRNASFFKKFLHLIDIIEMKSIFVLAFVSNLYQIANNLVFNCLYQLDKSYFRS